MKTQHIKSITTKFLNGRDQMLVENETFMGEKFQFFYDKKFTDEVEKQQIVDLFEKEKHFGEKITMRMNKPTSEIEVSSVIKSFKESQKICT